MADYTMENRHSPKMVDYVYPPEAPGVISNALYKLRIIRRWLPTPFASTSRLLMAGVASRWDMPCVLPARSCRLRYAPHSASAPRWGPGEFSTVPGL